MHAELSGYDGREKEIKTKMCPIQEKINYSNHHLEMISHLDKLSVYVMPWNKHVEMWYKFY